MGLKQLIAGMSQDTHGAAGYTVPVGGLTAEVLSKASAADGDFAWLATSVGGDAEGDSGKLVKFDPFGQLTGSTLNLTGYVIAGPSQQPARIVFGQDDWTVGSLTIQGPQAPFSPGTDIVLTLPHHGAGTFILDTTPNYSGNAATATLAATVTTNANLTGHITSSGNATVLGSFTLAQLSSAVSDADVARTDAAQTFTGTQTFSTIDFGGGSITGTSGTINIAAGGTNKGVTVNVTGTGTVVIFSSASTAEKIILRKDGLFSYIGASGFEANTGGGFFGWAAHGRTMNANGLRLLSTDVMGFQDNTTFGTTDAFFTRGGVATIVAGTTHATTATNYTIKAHNVTTGTGASMTIAGGTGSTAGGAVILATSSTTGAAAARMTVKASGVINVAGIPTSSSGLVTGDLWSNAGTLTVV